MLASGPAARTVAGMPSSPLPPRPPVRFYRMAAVEDRLDAMAGELDALRRRVAELEAADALAVRNRARKARRRERVRAAVEAEGR